MPNCLLLVKRVPKHVTFLEHSCLHSFGPSRGDLPEDMAAEYEAQRKAFDSLQKLTASLAETLGLDMPVLESTSLTRLKGSVKVISTNVSRISHLLSRF